MDRGAGDGFGNQRIAYRIDMRGNATINITYDGRRPVPGTKTFLVE